MLFIVDEGQAKNVFIAVKAKDEATMRERVKFTDTMRVVGGLTDNDVRVLADSAFAVISTDCQGGV